MTYPNVGLFELPIPKELKTLAQLRKLEGSDNEDIEAIEAHIKSNKEVYHERAIDHLLNHLYGLEVFKLTGHSPTIRAFCEKEEYADRWAEKIKLLKTNNGISNFIPGKDTNIPVFQQALELYLAREYNMW